MGEEMFKDLALSRERMHKYHGKLSEVDKQSEGLKLSVMVLKRSAWPFGASEAAVCLPPNVRKFPSSICLQLSDGAFKMEAELVKFVEYYNFPKKKGHQLKWDHALGSVTMKGRFNPGSKELSVSLFQAVVLLLFNGEEEDWSYSDIKEHTQIGQSFPFEKNFTH